jgi:dynein heavy chain
MHTLVLVWTHSTHYTTPQRITVVLQEICNDVIEQARLFIQPAEIFSAEPEEAADRIRLALKICESLRQTYHDCKKKTMEGSRPWIFDSKLVFGRLDQFLNRVKQIEDLFDTIVEFNRLEKVEVGGTKGKILSSQVAQIFAEFTTAYAGFKQIKYDVLDLQNKEFDTDMSKFQAKIEDLDRRIGTILCQGFEDCTGLHACFRLIESFSGLLSRPRIQHDFESKYFDLLQAYMRDLDDVKTIFLQGRVDAPIHYNMAPVTGAVAWCHELKERIGKAMEKLRSLNHSVMQSEEANLVTAK